MQLIARLTFFAAMTGAVVAVLVACRDTPGIVGASVPTLGSEQDPPACEPMCERLGQLCGYPPTDCVASCADYDDAHRTCVGQAASCQEALETCTTEEVDPDAGDEDASEPDPDASETNQDAGNDDAGDAGAEAGDAA